MEAKSKRILLVNFFWFIATGFNLFCAFMNAQSGSNDKMLWVWLVQAIICAYWTVQWEVTVDD